MKRKNIICICNNSGCTNEYFGNNSQIRLTVAFLEQDKILLLLIIIIHNTTTTTTTTPPNNNNNSNLHYIHLVHYEHINKHFEMRWMNKTSCNSMSEMTLSFTVVYTNINNYYIIHLNFIYISLLIYLHLLGPISHLISEQLHECLSTWQSSRMWPLR